MSDELDLLERLKRLEMELQRPLDGGLVQPLVYPGRGPMDYLPSAVLASILNEIFGSFGWRSEILHRELVGAEQVERTVDGKKRFQWSAAALVTVRLDLIFHGELVGRHDGLGTFTIEQSSKVQAISTAYKAAESRALFRAARLFGWRTGLGLYLEKPDRIHHGLVTADEPVIGKASWPNKNRRVFGAALPPVDRGPSPSDVAASQQLEGEPQELEEYEHEEHQEPVEVERPAPRKDRARPKPAHNESWLPPLLLQDIQAECSSLRPDDELPSSLVYRLERSLAWECCPPGVVPDKFFSEATAKVVWDASGERRFAENHMLKRSLRPWFIAATKHRREARARLEAEQADGAYSGSLPLFKGDQLKQWDHFDDFQEVEGLYWFHVYRAETMRREDSKGGFMTKTRLALAIPECQVMSIIELDHSSESSQRRVYAFLGTLDFIMGKELRHTDVLDYPALLLGMRGFAGFKAAAGKTWPDKLFTPKQRAEVLKKIEAGQV